MNMAHGASNPILDKHKPIIEHYKQKLANEIASHVSKWEINQKEMGKRMGLTQPRVNDLLTFKLERFSLDSLIKIAHELNFKTGLKITK